MTAVASIAFVLIGLGAALALAVGLALLLGWDADDDGTES